MSHLKRIFYLIAAICILAGPAHAGSVRVACAANFTSPMKELASLYEKQTGTVVGCSFGSTGMLYGQIIKGAPYDLFFAADQKRPALLFEAGQSEKPVLYAKGQVVLWTAKQSLAAFPDWKSAVSAAEVKVVAIANPKTAPYGLMAQEAMAKTGLTDMVKPKLVFGKNVGMTFQYAYSDSADMGFVALSQALSEKGSGGKYWAVEEAGLVYQDACVLEKENTDAAAFLNWLGSLEAKKIITHYGYK